MNGLAQLMVQPITIKKMYIIQRKFCFVKIIFIPNKPALQKKTVAIESVAFSFSVNCSFNNTFAL